MIERCSSKIKGDMATGGGKEKRGGEVIKDVNIFGNLSFRPPSRSPINPEES